MIGLQQMTAWRSTGFVLKQELVPDIVVTATSLDTGELAAVSAPTNGWVHQDQPFMLVGIEFPDAGCWQVSAEYRGQSLSYIVNVVHPDPG
jgi:hypothetical protein